MAKRDTTVTVNYVLDFPGAVFFGDMARADMADAARLQRIRREYEANDGQEMLWHELSQMGFDRASIRRCIVNPAAITSCGYGVPLPLR